MAVLLFVSCMSCGHVSLAYGEYVGKELVYLGNDTNTYEIYSMYVAEAGVSTTEMTIVTCEDEEALYTYIANLKLQNMTGEYTFDNSAKKLNLTYKTEKGIRFVELTDDVIRVLALDEDIRVWRNYYLPEGVDWEYLESILLLDRNSF